MVASIHPLPGQRTQLAGEKSYASANMVSPLLSRGYVVFKKKKKKKQCLVQIQQTSLSTFHGLDPRLGAPGTAETSQVP